MVRERERELELELELRFIDRSQGEHPGDPSVAVDREIHLSTFKVRGKANNLRSSNGRVIVAKALIKSFKEMFPLQGR